jgi:hypothetical protein
MGSPGARRCKAKSHQSGMQCKNASMVGMEVCYYHGGKSRTMGAGARSFTSGRYSKVLPFRIAADYEEGRAHPGLMSLREDLATLEARLMDLMRQVEQGDAGVNWSHLRQQLRLCDEALLGGDSKVFQARWAKLQATVAKGQSDKLAWGEIQGLWETRARLTKTEQDTAVKMQHVVTTEQLMQYFGLITKSITTIVRLHADPSVARLILGDLSQAIHRMTVHTGLIRRDPEGEAQEAMRAIPAQATPVETA